MYCVYFGWFENLVFVLREKEHSGRVKIRVKKNMTATEKGNRGGSGGMGSVEGWARDRKKIDTVRERGREPGRETGGWRGGGREREKQSWLSGPEEH